MKTGSEYLNSALHRAAELKKRSTTLKRTAGSIRTELKSKDLHGLTAKEYKTLEEAVVLLEKIASNMTNGAKSAASKENAFDSRRKLARTKIASPFGALKTIREIVPMLDVTRTLFWLEDEINQRLLGDTIRRASEEALDDIAYQLAKDDEDLDVAAANIWKRFQNLRPKLEAKHAELIARLEAMQ